MTLGDDRFAIQLTNHAIVRQLAGLCAKTHSATQIALLGTDFDVTVFVAPFSDKRHYRVLTVKLYGEPVITERHRHRYEVNNMLLKQIEAAGLRVAGRSGDDQLVEIDLD